MPMIDVYATAGTFTDKHQLASGLAAVAAARTQIAELQAKAR